MVKLQYIVFTTIISFFSFQNIAIATESNLNQEQNIARSALAKDFVIAQKSSKKKSSPELNDETIKALQEREKKLEGFKDMLKIDGVVPNVSSEGENNTDTGDEMMDALQKRQNKIQNLKELKKANDLVNQTKIKSLQQENIEIQNTQDLELIQKIVNDKTLDNEKIIQELQKQNFQIENLEQLEKVQKILSLNQTIVDSPKKDGLLSPQTAFRMFAIGIPATILVFLIATPFSKGIITVIKDSYDKKFGKPPIPDRSQNLYQNAWREISLIGKKAERLNDEKFGNEEFRTLIHYKIDLARNVAGFKELNYRVELLRAAIVTQKSFLKLESSELRYRGRKQQEFYRYVAEKLGADLSKDTFAQQIEAKKVELLPLIHTPEGKEALESYAKELNEISKHELGLKLLALFKKLELKDFSVIREISNIVEGLKGASLLEAKSLILTVKEYYDVFEKIAPILEISQQESSAATYARILQVVGLVHRHGDSYRKFKELVRLLHKWENTHETITTMREQFSDREYKLPPEFKQDIPGKNTHEQYSQYLQDLI